MTLLDKYDRAIEYLAAHPEQMESAWGNPHTRQGGCLFQYLSPTGRFAEDVDGVPYGCPTTHKAYPKRAICASPTIAAEIRMDTNIPIFSGEITLASLPRFAYYQRKMDALFPGRHQEKDTPREVDAWRLKHERRQWH